MGVSDGAEEIGRSDEEMEGESIVLQARSKLILFGPSRK